VITVLVGNLFESKAQTIVNAVNCVGIMGKGIALEFKKRFPHMFKDYTTRCERKEVRLGQPYLFKAKQLPHVLNFPTKDHWRSASKLTDLEMGLQCLLDHYKEWGISSIAVLALGCGEGGLEWRIVCPTLYRYLSKMDIPVEIYAPIGTSREDLQLCRFAGQRDETAKVETKEV
jgi:O-acetyl-ADP-ribose deacetylase (regulator of RNase III)